MRILGAFIIIIIAFGLSVPAQVVLPMGAMTVRSAAPAIVSQQICSGVLTANPSTTCTLSGGVTAGNYVMQYAGLGAVVTTWNTPTQSAGTSTIGAFVLKGTCPGGTSRQCIWLAPVTGTGSLTTTISATVGSTNLGGALYQLSNVTGGFDGLVYDLPAFCTTCTGASITTTGSNRMVVTCMLYGTTFQAFSAPGPFATFDFNSTDTVNTVACGHLLQSSPGTYTPTWMASQGSGQALSSIGLF